MESLHTVAVRPEGAAAFPKSTAVVQVSLDVSDAVVVAPELLNSWRQALKRFDWDSPTMRSFNEFPRTEANLSFQLLHGQSEYDFKNGHLKENKQNNPLHLLRPLALTSASSFCYYGVNTNVSIRHYARSNE